MKTDLIATYEDYFSLSVNAKCYTDCMRVMIPKYTQYREKLKQKHPQVWDNIKSIINKEHEKL